MSNVADALRLKALSLGFAAVGFSAVPLPPTHGARLDAFIRAGRHGEMDWLAARAAERRSPEALWPAVRSVISVAANYAPDHNPMDNLHAKTSGNISVYARGRDYHDVMKRQLRVLASWIATTYKTEVKLFVDTAPVLEKPLAARAGLGWQGKHTNVVSRNFGSWLFLGEVFTTLELPASAAEDDHCGACTRCVDICPTKAIVAPYQLDARRCISYLTIEHKGPIPPEFRKALGNRIYGCDDCLSVCPWNKFAQGPVMPGLEPRAENHLPLLAELVQLDDAAFRARFSGSPIKRIGRNRFIRNVLYAIGNSGEAALLPYVEGLLSDPDAVVADAAHWAKEQLS